MKAMTASDRKNEILLEVTQRIVSTLNPEKIYLFGSHAWGTATPDSDIDLLVLENRGSYTNYLNLYYRLESLFPGKKVEVVSKRGVKAGYFDAIKPELLYA